jgi:hypothetical protein
VAEPARRLSEALRRARQAVRWRPGLRLLALSLIIVSLQPEPILIVPGPPRQVFTSQPLLGVHTRLADEVEPWKIQRSLQMIRELGAPTIVEFFPWAYYHGDDGYIAWEHPDLVVEHAVAQGLTIVARLGLTPYWARPPDTPLNYLDASAYDDLATFAAAFAARYRGRVQYLVIGNEPNLSFEWGYRPTTAADYVALLSVVYPAVKAANPEVVVLGGALAPTLEPAGSPWGLNDLEYLAAMYEAGAADFFDGLAAHAYGLTFPPASEPGPDRLNFRRIELLRQVMVEHGDGATAIYITETGWNDHPRWTRAVRPAQRIQYTLDALDYAEANWPYVRLVALWVFRLPAPNRSYMDYYSLVTPEFVTRPLYDELRRYTGN